ncbi:hypothetical protein PLUTE_a0209 [Pseudoalteromonas luteoviolacea DSM 6061]|nr:hypothetical protein [Pseudoalteromonas luteoviolacea DSM 6061]
MKLFYTEKYGSLITKTSTKRQALHQILELATPIMAACLMFD